MKLPVVIPLDEEPDFVQGHCHTINTNIVVATDSVIVPDNQAPEILQADTPPNHNCSSSVLDTAAYVFPPLNTSPAAILGKNEYKASPLIISSHDPSCASQYVASPLKSLTTTQHSNIAHFAVPLTSPSSALHGKLGYEAWATFTSSTPPVKHTHVGPPTATSHIGLSAIPGYAIPFIKSSNAFQGLPAQVANQDSVNVSQHKTGYIIKRDLVQQPTAECTSYFQQILPRPTVKPGLFDRNKKFDRSHNVEQYTIARPNFFEKVSPTQQVCESSVPTNLENATDHALKSELTSDLKINALNICPSGMPQIIKEYRIPVLGLAETSLNSNDQPSSTSMKMYSSCVSDNTNKLTPSKSKDKYQSNLLHNPPQKRIKDTFPNWGQGFDKKLPKGGNQKDGLDNDVIQRNEMLNRMFKEFCHNKKSKSVVISPAKLNVTKEIMNCDNNEPAGDSKASKEETVPKLLLSENANNEGANNEYLKVKLDINTTKGLDKKVANPCQDIQTLDSIRNQSTKPESTVQNEVNRAVNIDTNVSKVCVDVELGEQKDIILTADHSAMINRMVTTSKRKQTFRKESKKAPKRSKQSNEVHCSHQESPQESNSCSDDESSCSKQCVGDISNHYLLQKPKTIHSSIKAVFDDERNFVGLLQNANKSNVNNHHLLQPVKREKSESAMTVNAKKSTVKQDSCSENYSLASTLDADITNVPSMCDNDKSLSAESIFTHPFQNVSANALHSSSKSEKIKQNEPKNTKANFVLKSLRSNTSNSDMGPDNKVSGAQSKSPQKQSLKGLDKINSTVVLKPVNVQLERLKLPLDKAYLSKTVKKDNKLHGTGSPIPSDISKEMQPVKTTPPIKPVVSNSSKISESITTQRPPSILVDQGSKVNNSAKVYYVIDRHSLAGIYNNDSSSVSNATQKTTTTGVGSIQSPKVISSDVYKYLMSKSSVSPSLLVGNIPASVSDISASPSETTEIQIQFNGIPMANKPKPMTVAQMLHFKRNDERHTGAKAPHQPCILEKSIKVEQNDGSLLKKSDKEIDEMKHNEEKVHQLDMTSLKTCHVPREKMITKVDKTKTAGSASGHPLQKSHNDPQDSKSSSCSSVELVKIPNQASSQLKRTGQHSYSVRIGDKVFIVQEASCSQFSQKASLLDKKCKKATLPAPKPKTEIKLTGKTNSSKKRITKRKKQEKERLTLRIRKKILKLLSKSEDPFDKLIFSLGLLPKDQSGTSSIPESRCISFSPVATSNGNVDTELTNCPCELGDKNQRYAETVQVKKDVEGEVAFQMHIVKIRLNRFDQRDLHRWHKFGDHTCTVQLSGENVITQIDAESLKSGFYHVTLCNRRSKQIKSGQTVTCPALLSQYPPSVSSLPLDSIGIAIGHLMPNDKQRRSSVDNVCLKEHDANRAIENLLGAKQMKEIPNLSDGRYTSVVESYMSPKYTGAKFYGDDMRDYFSSSVDQTQTYECAQQERRRSEAEKAFEMLQSRSSVKLTKYSAKAMALKIKQNELFESCRLLQQEKVCTLELSQDSNTYDVETL